MRRSAVAIAVLAALFLVGAALIVAEVAGGALDAGELAIRDPCRPRTPFPGTGIDATAQRIVIDALDGAACELGTSREELVLSLSPRAGHSIRWDDRTTERAVRAGLLRAVDDAERRGSLQGPVVMLLRQLVEHAPIQWLIDGGQELAQLLG